MQPQWINSKCEIGLGGNLYGELFVLIGQDSVGVHELLVSVVRGNSDRSQRKNMSVQ